MTHPIRRVGSRYSELLWVLAAAVVGLTVPGPGRALVRHEAVNVILAVLVFSAGLTVPRRVATRLHQHGPRVVAVTAATSGAVIGIAWIVSHLVAAGPLRFGVIAVGVAPVEIATLGVAPLGGADSLTSGVMLIVSTLFAAIIAGPTVALLAGGAHVDLGSVIVTLVVVVVVPFAIGLGIRERLAPRARSRASTMVTAAVTILVWLVASQAHLSDAYVGVVSALALLIVVGAVVGLALGRLLDAPAGRSTIFAASMRDFAIASGIATAAFGAAAAAPLGLYGIMVMLWGTGLAGTLRHRPAGRVAE